MTQQPPSLPPPPDDFNPPPPPGESGYSLPSGSPGRPVGQNSLANLALRSSLGLWWVCGLGAIAGIILGFIALHQIKQTGEDGRGMALAAIYFGAFVIVVGLWLMATIA